MADIRILLGCLCWFCLAVCFGLGMLIQFQIKSFNAMQKCQTYSHEEKPTDSDYMTIGESENTNKKKCDSGKQRFFIVATCLEITTVIVLVTCCCVCGCIKGWCRSTTSGGAVVYKSNTQSNGIKLKDVRKEAKSRAKYLGFDYKHVRLIKREMSKVLYKYINTLVYDTWKDNLTKVGADARGLSHQNVIIKDIFYVVNEAIMTEYESCHKETLMRYTLPDDLEECPIITRTVESQSSSNSTGNRQANQSESQTPLLSLNDCQIRPLEDSEVYLFHGTRLQNVNDILKSGFSIHKSERGLYGHPGVYLAESSQKADQYADDINDRRKENLSIFVVRTSLGQTVNYDPVTDQLTSSDTVVGGKGKRFREFVKRNPAQMYPEFLIIYDRL